MVGTAVVSVVAARAGIFVAVDERRVVPAKSDRRRRVGTSRMATMAITSDNNLYGNQFLFAAGSGLGVFRAAELSPG